LKIDIILDARASAAELAELGRLAEEAGIRGVWVSSLLDSGCCSDRLRSTPLICTRSGLHRR